jgi:transcriptional regulator with XRE-family HTH domain
MIYLKIKLLHPGKNIRARREQMELPQESFAAKCGFNRIYISILERRQRNPAFWNLCKLPDGLKLPLSTLIKGI